ncbi:MAG TPA: heterodisulfide reductase-related iron-sulfur binding cluster [Ilumatobacteraceae bacterium]|nr:heterodisulfide reductase-related iron-sulfur binding cluster [Ilumatobacteraceae bacterium]
MKLHLDDTALGSCVSCGLCLPHCPTFRVTGEEALSPRGRIAAMRAVHFEDAEVSDDFVRFMETCVQCRGCEPACPSGVPFGHLMEGTRDTLAAQKRMTPWWQRLGYRVLGHHRLLLAGSTALAAGQRLRLVPKRMGLPKLPLRRGAPTPSTGNDTWLFTGCVMDAWQRDTHRNTVKVLGAVDVTCRVPGAACCGALHIHAGLTDDAKRLAKRVMASMPGDAPIVVNSAGCGAALKDYGHLLGTSEAKAFSARVRDASEFVAPLIDRLRVRRRLGPVIVQDPCHLRHVQRAHLPVRTVLAAVADVVELDDEGLCCGAGGAYSALEPELAASIRERKLAAIARAGDWVVASANPGCAYHLAAAGVQVRHPMDLVAEAL